MAEDNEDLKHIIRNSDLWDKHYNNGYDTGYDYGQTNGLAWGAGIVLLIVAGLLTFVYGIPIGSGY